MKETKRLRRIVAVRTTQRDLSALRLQQAQRHAHAALAQLNGAEERCQESAQRVSAGHELTTTTLERLDADRTAARADRAAWQVKVFEAEQVKDQAREQVETQHRLLRQSEKLKEQAAQRLVQRVNTAEQQAADEQAGRGSRRPR